MVGILRVLLPAMLLLFPLAAEGRTFGAGVSLQEVTPVSKIEASPETFVGKRVLVKGLVVEVCARRGCWMDIASDRPFSKIQIKVTDGEIVFPMSARGKVALVEGVVEKLSLSQEDTVRMAKHKAEEQGIPFDPESVKGPETLYRIRGLGAEIPE